MFSSRHLREQDANEPSDWGKSHLDTLSGYWYTGDSWTVSCAWRPVYCDCVSPLDMQVETRHTRLWELTSAMKRIEVTITVGDRRVTLEGPEDFVREEVERLAGLSARASSPPPVGLAEKGAKRGGAADQSVVSERELVMEKKPSGHLETVAVLAYCLAKAGQVEFGPDDIRRAYLRAGVRPPKVVAQALRDAKNVRDFIEQGSEKGHYRLSPHGERTVIFDLPTSRSAGTPREEQQK
jgi:hypothetical protein